MSHNELRFGHFNGLKKIVFQRYKCVVKSNCWSSKLFSAVAHYFDLLLYVQDM